MATPAKAMHRRTMTHQDSASGQHVEEPRDRAFGLVVACVCLSVALGPLRHGHAPRWWAFAAASVFALVALRKPALLATPSRLWTKLGVLLGKVVSPIALAILLYGVLTPVAMVIRVTGRDPLRLKLDRDADSYDLFGGRPRKPDELLVQRHMDLAASIQLVIDEIVLRLTRSLRTDTGIKNLCLAGGVALNCVANGKVLRDGRFEHIYIQPAAGDAGGAVGAALVGYHLQLGRPRQVNGDAMRGAYLGPAFTQADIETRLTGCGAKFERLDDAALISTCARDLAQGKALGWFQGRMEFGPRALGNRSILGDPRSPNMQKTLNLKVKHRESFRPFAPSVLRERVSDWFELDSDSPYMLLVADVVKRRRREMTAREKDLFGIDKLNVSRSDIPAVTHVDYSARIQTVHADTNPRYYALLSAFERETGCPILVNTSFNVRGEPIVCKPEDGFRCFMGCELDVLAVGNCYLRKDAQDPALKQNHAAAFEPD